MSTKPNAWTLSPHLTAAPELWRGCVFCAPFWESGGVPMDVARNVRGTLAHGDPFWGTGPRGAESDHSLQGAWQFADDPRITNLGDEFTSVVVIRHPINDLIFDFGYILGKNYGGSGTKWFYIAEDIAANIVRFYWDDGSDNHLLDASIPNDGEVHVLVQTNSVSNSIREGYVDGEIGVSGSAISGITNNGPVTIGERVDFSNNREYRGKILFCAMWNRRLLPDEVKLISADPFAMLRPAGF